MSSQPTYLTNKFILWLVWVMIAICGADGQAKDLGSRAKNVREAVEKAPDDNGMVAILLHGSDWNQSAEQFKSELFDQSELLKLLPNGVVLASVDRKQNPSAKDTVRLEGVDQLPSITFRTFPSILILDGVGRAVVAMQPIVQIKSIEELSDELNAWHRKIVARDKLLAQARTASGVQQATLIGKALSSLGVGLGPHDGKTRKHSFDEAIKHMKAVDPQDESGWIFATEFSFGRVASKTNATLKESGLLAAEAEIEGMLKNPHLIPEQRQEALRQLFLMYKSQGEALSKQIDILKRVSDAAPETWIGKGAANWAKYMEENPNKKY